VFNDAITTAGTATALITVRNLAISGYAWLQRQHSSISQHVSKVALKTQLLPNTTEHSFNGVSTEGFKRLAGLTSPLNVSVSDSFLDLYKFAQTAVIEGRQQEFSLLIAILAYHNEQHAGLLHAIMTVASHPDVFGAIAAPPHTNYSNPHEIIPARAAVRALFRTEAIGKTLFASHYISSGKAMQLIHGKVLTINPSYTYSTSDPIQSHYEAELSLELDVLVNAVMSQWPTRTVDLTQVHVQQIQYRVQSKKYLSDLARVTNSKLQAGLDRLFTHHHCNLDLHNMLRSVDKKLVLLLHEKSYLPSVDKALVKDVTSVKGMTAINTVPSPFLQQPVTPHATAQLANHSELTTLAKHIHSTGQTVTAEVTCSSFAVAISVSKGSDNNNSNDSDNNSDTMSCDSTE
jgi:hypothetical protein